MLSSEERSAIQARANTAAVGMTKLLPSHYRRITTEISAADVPALLAELARIERVQSPQREEREPGFETSQDRESKLTDAVDDGVYPCGTSCPPFTHGGDEFETEVRGHTHRHVAHGLCDLGYRGSDDEKAGNPGGVGPGGDGAKVGKSHGAVPMRGSALRCHDCLQVSRTTSERIDRDALIEHLQRHESDVFNTAESAADVVIRFLATQPATAPHDAHKPPTPGEETTNG